LSQPQLTSPAYVRNGSEIALRRTTEQCRRKAVWSPVQRVQGVSICDGSL